MHSASCYISFSSGSSYSNPGDLDLPNINKAIIDHKYQRTFLNLKRPKYHTENPISIINWCTQNHFACAGIPHAANLLHRGFI